MQKGEQLQLTDGKGNIFTAEIVADNKKANTVKVLSTAHSAHPASKIIIGISLIKNISRFEWFAEKATEIGVSAIVPLLCERTERQHFRMARLNAVLISAMLQSRQVWLPVLKEPLLFKQFVKQSTQPLKYIAHCVDGEKKNLVDQAMQAGSDRLVLIGPEGDFTQDEINEALQHDFIPVSLGINRLRTETAGVVACVLLNAR